MTRIISGEWRGHILPKLKHGSVRPTTDRARTIMFDTLWDVRDMEVLDLFSGTGGLGFEALSRGARALTSVDQDRHYIKSQEAWMSERNKPFRAYTGDVRKVLSQLSQHYDLILADPPYDMLLDDELIRLIENHAKQDSMFVYERSKQDSTPIRSSVFQLAKEKVVADTRIQFYKAAE